MYNFKANEYACVVYTDNEQVHMVDGQVVDVASKSLVMDVDNVRGPVTRTTIPFNLIDDRIA